ncbi:sensor histidine kinase [Inmirania thermothiophila]|uniref:histidine kinase n=1 Tax=Inmirania thermothiophila TaxID=1750597 RepID=A0A3N1Y1W6_9GAMM|nr:ATP-binding protein [Inmirania thermothiophila]ROR32521.1 two-component system sensor histidine kinase HupT/HoxJ [Inmirania thermothiophila]
MAGRGRRGRRLLEAVELPPGLAGEALGEAAWIDVIRKMDEVYADLVRYQVELEEKNAALEEAQRFIASVLASMSDVLLVVDVRCRIQRANGAVERFTGRSEAALLGRPVHLLFDRPSRERLRAFAARIREAPVEDCELTLRGADGRPVPLSVNCTARRDGDGRFLGMVLLGRPVGELRRAYAELDRAHRELKQAQAQLVHSEKMASLGRLVAGVAHELNNPISFVYGNVHALGRYRERIVRYLTLVHERFGGDSELEQAREALRIDRLLEDLAPLLEGTLEGARRVSEIVQDLKRFSAEARGPVEPCDLAELARTAWAWTAKGVRGPLPRLVMAVEGPLTVRAHRGQIQQVLMNLLQNAVDAVAGREDGAVEVRGGRTAAQVWLEVADNGPGIPETDLGRVFDPFFTTKPVGEGMGLGLSISYGIVERHGGSLEAANRPQGGAVFTLRLPAAAPPP